MVNLTFPNQKHNSKESQNNKVLLQLSDRATCPIAMNINFWQNSHERLPLSQTNAILLQKPVLKLAHKHKCISFARKKSTWWRPSTQPYLKPFRTLAIAIGSGSSLQTCQQLLHGNPPRAGVSAVCCIRRGWLCASLCCIYKITNYIALHRVVYKYIHKCARGHVVVFVSLQFPCCCRHAALCGRQPARRGGPRWHNAPFLLLYSYEFCIQFGSYVSVYVYWPRRKTRPRYTLPVYSYVCLCAVYDTRPAALSLSLTLFPLSWRMYTTLP